jgi:hypothetical protein
MYYEYYSSVTHIYTGIHIYTVTHPFEFEFVFIFEIETHKFTSFVRIGIRIRQKDFQFERPTLQRRVGRSNCHALNLVEDKDSTHNI